MKISRTAVALPIAFVAVLMSAEAKPTPTAEERAAERSSLKRAVVPEKELLIRDLNVVESARSVYPGPFSFGALMEGLEGNNAQKKAPDLVRAWLDTWRKDQEVNGDTVPARAAILEKIIQPWQEKDGYDPSAGKPWMPNLANAPFRLLAIVNRLDLAGRQITRTLEKAAAVAKDQMELTIFEQGIKSQAIPLPKGIASVLVPEGGGGGYTGNPLQLATGEGRFVFAVLDKNGDPLPGDFTVILEYPLISPVTAGVSTDEALRQWAMDWHELGKFDSFDEPYLAALEKLTARFSNPGNRTPVSNGMTLRIRTNEKSLGPIREMREFTVKTGDDIIPAPVASTPREIFNKPKSSEQALLNDFLAGHGAAVVTGKEAFPSKFTLTLKGADRKDPTRNPAANLLPVMAGACTVPEQTPAFFWSFGGIRDNAVRREFSMQTCNGCHGGETNTADGLHVKPRRAGEIAAVSDFLKAGKLNVADPAKPRDKVIYHELDDRVELLTALIQPKSRKRDRELLEIANRRRNRGH